MIHYSRVWEDHRLLSRALLIKPELSCCGTYFWGDCRCSCNSCSDTNSSIIVVVVAEHQEVKCHNRISIEVALHQGGEQAVSFQLTKPSAFQAPVRCCMGDRHIRCLVSQALGIKGDGWILSETTVAVTKPPPEHTRSQPGADCFTHYTIIHFIYLLDFLFGYGFP